MGLHLRYRLWIAELNHDISILRILEDYRHDIMRKDMDPVALSESERFGERFMQTRTAIDDLRHIMHLDKMQLAAESRQGQQLPEKVAEAEHHQTLENQYLEYRKSFEQLKSDFINFENKWLR